MARKVTKSVKHQTGKPIPEGFTLHYSPMKNTNVILRTVWSRDGSILATTPIHQHICLWNGETGEYIRTLNGHDGGVNHIGWSLDNRTFASCSADRTICVWDTDTGVLHRRIDAHAGDIPSITWSPDGQVLASGSADGTIRLWNTFSWELIDTLHNHEGEVRYVTWSPSGNILASCSTDQTIRLWERHSKSLTVFRGHRDTVQCLSWSPNGMLLASASFDNTIGILNVGANYQSAQLQILPGHTDIVRSVSFSADSRLLASNSLDGTVRLWECDTWEGRGILVEPVARWWPPSIVFHPHKASILATLGQQDTIVRVWNLDLTKLLHSSSPAPAPVHYTTAKIALVGDSGVGKTGLGQFIATGKYLPTESTHGQQFWVVDKLVTTREDGTRCEVVLWDFAGQPTYRPIHSLFLDNIDLALLLFDPSRYDTFTGVEYWLRQLSYEKPHCRTILVAARTDVSPVSFPLNELEIFCREHNIDGGFVVTSAKDNSGVDTLLERIRQQIDWNAKPTTITTETFNHVKNFVLALKANQAYQQMLVSFAQLRSLLEKNNPEWRFTDDTIIGSVKHLQNHGYVTILNQASDAQCILLKPDLLINLSASYMSKARSNEKGLGTLEEGRALRNEYEFPEVKSLNDDERKTLLNAVTELFLKRNMCFRESVDNRTFLIFPSLILERPPQLVDKTDLVEDTSYVITGEVENISSIIAVLLGYSPSFRRTNYWREQAQYETARGEICGFKQTNDGHNELELALYYGKDTPTFVRSRFQGLFEEILYTRNINVQKYPPLLCPQCHRVQESRVVIQRMRELKEFLFCAEDGTKIALPMISPRIEMSQENYSAVVLDQTITGMCTTYETALVRVKGLISNKQVAKKLKCFVSYAQENAAHERWVLQLAEDLRKADIDVKIARDYNAKTEASVLHPIDLIENQDFIIVVGTPTYRETYDSVDSDTLMAERSIIDARISGAKLLKETVLPVLLEGDVLSSFPPLLQERDFADFTHEANYYCNLFKLVLAVYHIETANPVVLDQLERLQEDAAKLSGQIASSSSKRTKVFISYSHSDDEFLQRLRIHLASEVRNQKIELWDDTQITPGSDWQKEIEDALQSAKVAVLLVSSDFLASDFIANEELPSILSAALSEGITILPVLLKPCMYQHTPLAKFQFVNKPLKPLISMDESYREETWVRLAESVERVLNPLRSKLTLG